MINDSENTVRSFIVTAKFKVSGVLPDIVTKEHIESNIRSEIEHVVGEIPLSSEHYDINNDVEWAVYLEGNVKINSEEFSINICEEPFCEHCGSKHTDFGVEVSDGGTSWRLNCFISENSDLLSKEEINDLYKQEKLLKKEFYNKKLKELEDDKEEN
jgi:hypothetical protein